MRKKKREKEKKTRHAKYMPDSLAREETGLVVQSYTKGGIINYGMHVHKEHENKVGVVTTMEHEKNLLK